MKQLVHLLFVLLGLTAGFLIVGRVEGKDFGPDRFGYVAIDSRAPQALDSPSYCDDTDPSAPPCNGSFEGWEEIQTLALNASALAAIGESVTGEQVGTGNGTTTPSLTNLVQLPIVPNSVTITDGTQSVRDDGNGNFQGGKIVTGEQVGTGNGTQTPPLNNLLNLPAVAGSVTITAGAQTATDDGKGNFGKSVTGEQVGTGNGTTTPPLNNLLNLPVAAGSVTITAGAQTVTDNGTGNFQGGGTGTINYSTGALSITWAAAVTTGTSILATYRAFQGGNGAGTINYTTGALSITWAAAVTTGTPILAAYKSSSAGGTGTIDYTTGAIAVTWASAVTSGVSITASYKSKSPRGNSISLQDDDFIPLNIFTSSPSPPDSFKFKFYGVSYSTVTVSSNGFIRFTDAPVGPNFTGVVPKTICTSDPDCIPDNCNALLNVCILKTNLPSGLYPGMIAGYLTDLDPTISNPSGGIFWLRCGTAVGSSVCNKGPDRLIIEFKDISPAGGGNCNPNDSIPDTCVSFEFKLFKDTNQVLVVYKKVLSNGKVHVAGIQGPDGTAGITWDKSTNSITASGGISIRYQFPPLPAATALFVNDAKNTSQFGEPGQPSNPAILQTFQPVFSAFFDSTCVQDVTDTYKIQVSTTPTFDPGTVLLDSGAQNMPEVGISSFFSPCNPNNQDANPINDVFQSRTCDIAYTGPPLNTGIEYFWRITFWSTANSKTCDEALSRSVTPFEATSSFCILACQSSASLTPSSSTGGGAGGGGGGCYTIPVSPGGGSSPTGTSADVALLILLLYAVLRGVLPFLRNLSPRRRESRRSYACSHEGKELDSRLRGNDKPLQIYNF